MISRNNSAAASPDLETVRPPLNLVGWYNGDVFLQLNTRSNHLGIGREAVANVIILCFEEIDEKIINGNRLCNMKLTIAFVPQMTSIAIISRVSGL